MKVLPAIDLLGAKAVRLRKGLRDEVTVYSERPWELAAEFARAGAERIHIVDLDGAFSGERAHASIVERIARSVSIPIQVGGGIRNERALEAVFAAGADRAVLGTAAVKSPAFVEQACRRYPGRIVVAVDAKDGVVAVEGWVEAAEVTAIELGRQAASWGAAALLYTDVARDGMHSGPNIEATAGLARAVPGAEVIASGGVSSLDDIRRLAAAGIKSVVVGRAIYDKHFTLEEALAEAAEEEEAC